MVVGGPVGAGGNKSVAWKEASIRTRRWPWMRADGGVAGRAYGQDGEHTGE